MASTVLSGTLTAGGDVITLSKTWASEHLVTRKLELAVGESVTFTFDNTLEGDDLQMLFIQALNNSDNTQHTQVAFSVLDADITTPATGTAWRSINGIHLSWEDLTLSATYRIGIYNNGANKADVTVIIGLDGA